MAESKVNNKIQDMSFDESIPRRKDIYGEEFQIVKDKHGDESLEDNVIHREDFQIGKDKYDEESLGDKDVFDQGHRCIKTTRSASSGSNLDEVEHSNHAAKMPEPKHVNEADVEPKHLMEAGKEVVEEEYRTFETDDEDEDADDEYWSSEFQENNISSFSSYKEDTWSEEAVSSSHMKRFPPPISILAKASHPDVPSHMPRVFWRAVKRGGRFVLQEAQARPREFFQAIRENGRLRLQLVRPDGNFSRVHAENAIEEAEEQSITGKIIHKPSNHIGKGEEHLENLALCGMQEDSEPLESICSHDDALLRTPSAVEISMDKPGKGNDNAEMAKSLSFIVDHGSEGEAALEDLGMGSEDNCSGAKVMQSSQPVQLSGTVGFDNALNLLAPSQSILQYSFTRMGPVIG